MSIYNVLVAFNGMELKHLPLMTEGAIAVGSSLGFTLAAGRLRWRTGGKAAEVRHDPAWN